MKRELTLKWPHLRHDLLVLLICYAFLSCLLTFPNATKAQVGHEGKGVGVKLVSQLPSKEKRWALIIGVDEYEKDISSLRGAVNDAKALKNVLVKYAGFPEDQIILLTTDAANADHLPRRANILDELNKLSYRVPEDGLLLFSFSGHGASVGRDAYLIPSDGRITKNLKLLRDFSIDVQRIKETIEEIKVKQVLIFLDACRNEPGRGEAPNSLNEAYKRGFRFEAANSDIKAFATLYATSIGERAFEFYDSTGKQYRGYFSYAIEEGIKGKAANANGEITLSGLISYVENSVPKKVRFDKGENQEPFKEVAGYKESELVLAISTVRPVVAQPDNQTSIASAISSNSNATNQPMTLAETNPSSMPLIKTSKFREKARSLIRYEYVDAFSEGLATVAVNDKWGVIDETGKEVVPPKYDLVFDFREGLAAVQLDGKEGFIDKTGKEVIPLKYDSVTSFSEGLAVAILNNKRGYIDRTGKEVIPMKYDSVDSFSEGLANVESSDQKGFIDKTGKEVISTLKYKYAYSFSEGVARVELNGKWGFIDKSGKEVTPIKYENVGLGLDKDITEGLAPIKLNKKYGFIDKTGKEVIAPRYDLASIFSEGLASVEMNDKWGFIDKTGREVTHIKYDRVEHFSGGLSRVRLDWKYGYIDRTGREVVAPIYNDVWCEAFRKEGIIGVVLNGKRGFVDLDGNESFDFQ